MTTNTFANLSINSLLEQSYIAGTYIELPFDVFDADGNAVDISTFTYTWLLSPYGQPSTVTLTKSGVFQSAVVAQNRFIVYLYSTDTSGLSGKYVHQPVIVSNPGYEFRMGQGFITFIPQIGT